MVKARLQVDEMPVACSQDSPVIGLALDSTRRLQRHGRRRGHKVVAWAATIVGRDPGLDDEPLLLWRPGCLLFSRERGHNPTNMPPSSTFTS